MSWSRWSVAEIAPASVMILRQHPPALRLDAMIVIAHEETK